MLQQSARPTGAASHLLGATSHLHGWLYTPFYPSNWILALLYALQWIVMLGCLYIFFVRAPRKDPSKRWNTQDVFVLAILSVLLLAWDSFLNDELIGPIISALPVVGNFLNWIQLPDLPFMFIVMVAAAMIRKPGAVTAILFVEMILADLIFSPQGFNVLNDWPDALNQGVFGDLWIMWRGEAFLGSFWGMAVDGFVIGFLRGGPNVLIGNCILDPFLFGIKHTWADTIGTNIAGDGGFVGNAIGNGVEAAITAALAVRTSDSVGVLSGYRSKIGLRRTARQPAMASVSGDDGRGGFAAAIRGSLGPDDGEMSSGGAPPPTSSGTAGFTDGSD